MIELITIVALIVLIRFWLNPYKKRKNSAVEKGNKSGKQNSGSIVGKSTFVLSIHKKAKIERPEESGTDSSGKMEIEIPLIYEPDNELLEEQEELERLGLQTDYSSNVTPDKIISVVNEVGNDQSETTPRTGKLLYENENTDWVEQLSSSSHKNANRITDLIDLHLERLAQPNSHVKPDDGFSGFDIREYLV
jgi:hypothetical protein